MPDITPKERLQPALLDRLRDDHPNEELEPLENRVISMRDLHQSVVRDLEWLLNCENLITVQDLTPYPAVAKSVVNFGIRGFSGRYIASDDVIFVEQMVRESLLNFEPRILPETLSVQISANKEAMDNSRIILQIRGELWSIPVPLEFFMASEVDIETGNVSITKTSD